MIYRLKVTEVQSLHIRFWKKQGKYFISLMVWRFKIWHHLHFIVNVKNALWVLSVSAIYTYVWCYRADFWNNLEKRRMSTRKVSEK